MSDCNVIKDLIPLKVEGLLSNESDNLVNEYLKECEKCRRYYNSVKLDYENIGNNEEKEAGIVNFTEEQIKSSYKTLEYEKK
ncbi:zf-HC2 domain-containing protein [Clostridium cadaveris]